MMGSNERKKRRQLRHLFIVAAILIAGYGAFRYYELIQSSAPTVSGSFVAPDGVTTTQPVILEVADDDAERAKGLMYRRALAPQHGMIFMYEQEDEHVFWMKNTYVPLDIIFLNRNSEVVGMLENVPILNEERRTISKPSQSIIELKAGSVAHMGVKIGWRFIRTEP